MPVSPTWPGVYVQEVPSGVRTISGVSTSVALFVGFTREGRVFTPTLLTSWSDYVRAFGEDVTAGDMARQVKLFFLNGGTTAWVVRVAEGAAAAAVILEDSSGTDALALAARSPGTSGDRIRATVTWSGAQPEDTFNLELFRWEPQPNGTLVPRDPEVWRGLSMDPDSGSFAPAVLDASSKLVAGLGFAPAPVPSRSYAMIRLGTGTGNADFAAEAAGAVVEVSVGGSPYVAFAVPAAALADETTYAASVVTAINAAFTQRGLPVPVGLDAGFDAGPNFGWFYLESPNGNVFVRRSGTNPGAAALAWGTEQGGIEVTRYAQARPVPTGVTVPAALATGYPDVAAFDALISGTTATITLHRYDPGGVQTPADVTATWVAGDPLRTILARIRDAVNAGPGLLAGQSWPWAAESWGHRVAIRPVGGPLPAGADDDRDSGYAGAGTLAAVPVLDNVRYYSLGVTGVPLFQNSGAGGADGTAPNLATTYDLAYDVVRREVDLFNLLVLPRSADESVLTLEELWGVASTFAEERRALLLMEPPPVWSGVQTPMNEVATLRIGLSKQYAALYYPRVLVQEGRLRIPVGATGALAGLMARTDSARGVWKAPAGTEADLRGVVGLAEMFSDRENGVLNPRGVNLIRSFPTGIVSWGARTMDGLDETGSEYKYVPVRRLALYLEESLFRGLKWVVFEGNDESLWAQIRLNVGAFMQGLYRQGAFQGKTPTEAYFVKCDRETTTQNDINLGIVNVWVGFAPLKPAEFVILSLQQMAGQMDV